MKYILKTSKLLINSKQGLNNIFIYTGSPNENQKNKGKLIIMIELPKKTQNPQNLSNLIIQKIHKLYYNSPLNEQEAVLENILEEVNENIPLITEVDTSWLKKINAVIAIIYRQEVFFSPLGDVSAWVTSENKLVNIFDYLKSDIDEPKIDKIFTNILSGNIEPHQLLMFTTNSIFNHLSKDQVSKIIVNNEPAGLSLKLKEKLYKIKNENFCLTSIKLSPYIKREKAINKSDSAEPLNKTQGKININVSSQQSIDELLKSQQITEDILKKGKSKIQKEEELKIPSKEEMKKETKPEIKKIPRLKKSFHKLSKAPKIHFKKYFQIIHQKFLSLYSAVIFAIKELRKPLKPKLQKISPKNKKLKSQISLPSFKSPISNISKNKIIIILAAILLLGFTIGTIIIQNNKKLAEEKMAYKQTLQDIEEKQEEYDLLLIYKDKGQAKEKLQEISELINKLPQKTTEQKEKYNKILDQFTEIFNEVRKLNTIKNPDVFSELNFKANKIVKYGNNLIIAGSNSDQLVNLDLKTREIKNLNIKDISYENISVFEKNENFLYGLQNNDKVIKIDLDKNEGKQIEITHHPNYIQANDMTMYNGRIYASDNQSNQIYKYNQGTENFGKGEAWINDETNINHATSITIDGNIYLGTNTGELIKLYTGVKSDFQIEEIDPKVENINKVFTDITIQEIYFIDNNSKRLIIINKKGELVNQYYFPTLSSMDNFVVDGAAKKIYIQSENKIIVLDISQN